MSTVMVQNGSVTKAGLKLTLSDLRILYIIVGSYSFRCNVLYARDPREMRIYCQHCSREYKNKTSVLGIGYLGTYLRAGRVGTYPVFPAGDRVGRLRPQAAPHQKPRSERGQALGLAAAPAVARPPPGRPTRVFGQGACAWAALVAGVGPIGFGRGVVELHVEGVFAGANRYGAEQPARDQDY